MSPDEVLAIAEEGARRGCAEALFALGDRPEERWPQARKWLEEEGYDSTLAYVRSLAVGVLEETGLLPHINAGVMSWEEMVRLRPAAPSLGMMLETTSRRLFETPGEAHFRSPDKDPVVRIRVLEDAGRLSVPFTTGLLLGIGETLLERAESISALRRVARTYGHVQEVIVQNFRAKPRTAMQRVDDLGMAEYLAAIAVTRAVLGPKMRVQAPPNLSNASARSPTPLGSSSGPGSPLTPGTLAGVDDWGGVSPLTPDHVNPERPRPPGGEQWIDPRLSAHVTALAAPDGLLRGGVRPVGLPWQEPDGGLQDAGGSGRVDLAHEVDTEGRTADRRADFNTVYGDWDEVRAIVPDPGTSRTPPRASTDSLAALRAAEANPGGLSDAHALTLITAESDLLDQVCRLADELRRDAVGNEVTYVVNRNINFTNVCYVGCWFCAFAQRRSDPDAYSLSLEQVADRAEEAWRLGATEVCMQGGIDPELPATGYFDLARAVKQRVPRMHVHAFSPMEIVNGATRTGLSYSDFLSKARDAGLDTIPGTAAEILDDEARWVLTKEKLPTAAWIDIVSTAHRVGLRSSSTMMYGHVDNPRHWITHLRVLTRIQDQTGGFTEFVPLPFVHNSAPIYLAGIARRGPTHRDNLAVHALARILLHGRIDNIQTSWAKLGVEGTRAMLRSGANDLGGTLMEETISRMAGSEHGSAKTTTELVQLAAGVNRPAVQRTTAYQPLHDPLPARGIQSTGTDTRPGSCRPGKLSGDS